MNILLVACQPADQQALARLAVRGHSVQAVRDVRAASNVLAQQRFDAALVDWGIGQANLADLVKDIRSKELETYCTILAVVANPAPMIVAAAFETGVDDVLRRPVIGEEIFGRLAAVERLKRWAAKIASTGGVARDFAGGTNVSSLRAWNEAELAIGVDFQGVFGRDLVAGSGGAPVTDGLSAELPLTLAAEGMAVSLLVSVGAASLRSISQIVFGTVVEPEGLRDVVRELANTAGGAFKRAAEAEGVTLTTGLPLDVPPSQRGAKTGSTVREFWMQLSDSTAQIHCRLYVSSKALERVSPGRLAEGMVLARDLISDKGTLLLPSGTRLTEATIHKLGVLLPPTTVIEVARAA